MKFTTVFGFFSIAAAAAIPEDGSGAASPAPSGPAPSGPAPSGPAPSGPAPSGPATSETALSETAPSGPAPSGPATSEPAPSAACEPLLPWVAATANSPLCGKYKGSEAACGTKAFCKLYGSEQTRPDSKYDSVAQCLARHEPEPVRAGCNKSKASSPRPALNGNRPITQGLQD
ncbi:hypothetical protein MHUMG1_01474 [Metarhizium humberi]|uniref:Uncharacterized protein n=1 Tax=Metarhizium humberi TaxID=2596975 RepID=A0A9P8MHJ5_9HYPO|nr:hypothetical protein MHUMG1_01474 [Metarhizium humberi]